MSSTNRAFSLYKPYLKPLARELRKNSTPGEKLLWRKLQRKQLLGYKFIRQTTILHYIVDFYCRELKLIIELDGFSHDFKMDYDSVRQKELEQDGYFVLRFQEKEARDNIDNVMQRIVDAIETLNGSHTPRRV